MPSISIALCTYNGAPYLEAQLQSIVAQTTPPLELCVGDDGSTDDTLRILDRFATTAPFPVSVTRNPANLGYGENFIQTAKRCTGEWIAFCDQDDLWVPTKLERCAELIDQGPADIRLLVHNAAIVDAEGKYQADMIKELGYDWGKATTYFKHKLPPVWMMYGNCMVFDRSLVSDVPSDGRAWPWYNAEAHDAHDAWIPILAAALGSVLMTNDQLINYRRHASNASSVSIKRNLKMRLTAKFLPDAQYFDARAYQLGRLSDRLGERVEHVSRVEYKNDLQMAAQRYRELGRAYASRAQVARGHSVATRLRALRTLVSVGAYRAPAGWGFKIGGLLKDTLHALVGGMFSSEPP